MAANVISSVVSAPARKNVAPGTRERLGFYEVTGKAYQPEDTATRHAVRSRKRPVHAVVREVAEAEPEPPRVDTSPFTSAHLKALGIQVTTREAEGPYGWMRISMPRVRCLEVPA